jgi:cytochrome c oxidase subunit 3
MFLAGAKGTDWRLGALNTVVLLTSSLTMALAIHYVQVGKSAKANTMLWTTIACGLVFMVVKYFEYSHKIHLGNLPGAWFSGDTKGFENMGMYYSFYFMMTGIHGAHVLVGLGLIAWVAIRNSRGEFSPEHYTAVEGVGLFWHLVDLVWIFLFPLLYLVE